MLSAPGQVAQGAIAFGPFRLFAAERLIERSGEPLAAAPWNIVIALVERAGEVVCHRDLIDRATTGALVAIE